MNIDGTCSCDGPKTLDECHAAGICKKGIKMTDEEKAIDAYTVYVRPSHTLTDETITKMREAFRLAVRAVLTEVSAEKPVAADLPTMIDKTNGHASGLPHPWYWTCSIWKCEPVREKPPHVAVDVKAGKVLTAREMYNVRDIFTDPREGDRFEIDSVFGNSEREIKKHESGELMVRSENEWQMPPAYYPNSNFTITNIRPAPDKAESPRAWKCGNCGAEHSENAPMIGDWSVPQNHYCDDNYHPATLVPAAPIAEAEKPRIVCLCGSTRFYDAFQKANYSETMAGRIVLSVGFYPHSSVQAHGEGIGCDDEQKKKLDDLHKRKIDISDEVFVLNVGGYIGSSTRGEIEYATKINKPIRYLEPIPTPDRADSPTDRKAASDSIASPVGRPPVGVRVFASSDGCYWVFGRSASAEFWNQIGVQGRTDCRIKDCQTAGCRELSPAEVVGFYGEVIS